MPDTKSYRGILFFDVDGTLISEDTHIIPNSAENAVKQARENGYLAIVNTGRPYTHIENKVLDIGFDGYICSCGTYIRCDGEVLLYKTMSSDICSKTVSLVRTCGLDAVYESLHGIYYDPIHPASKLFQREMGKFKSRGFDTSRSVDEPDFGFDKFCAYVNEKSDVTKFRNAIGAYFDIIDRDGRLIELVPAGFSKAGGMRFVHSYYGVPHEKSVAIGDSMNDLPMFMNSHISILMGSGDPALYNKVTFVTKSPNDDGVAFALRHFGII